MTFGEFATGLTLLYVVYYSIVIATDFYKAKKQATRGDGIEQEIDISQAVGEYQAVNVSIDAFETGSAEFRDPADMPDEDDTESKDIEVHNMEGIMACDLRALLSSSTGMPSLFEGIVLD